MSTIKLDLQICIWEDEVGGDEEGNEVAEEDNKEVRVVTESTYVEGHFHKKKIVKYINTDKSIKVSDDSTWGYQSDPF